MRTFPSNVTSPFWMTARSALTSTPLTVTTTLPINTLRSNCSRTELSELNENRGTSCATASAPRHSTAPTPTAMIRFLMSPPALWDYAPHCVSAPNGAYLGRTPRFLAYAIRIFRCFARGRRRPRRASIRMTADLPVSRCHAFSEICLSAGTTVPASSGSARADRISGVSPPSAFFAPRCTPVATPQ